MIVGDFNNDTISDILFISYNYYYNTIGVLIGYANGLFANQTIYSTVVHPLSIAVSNFNNDTVPDVIVISSDWDSTEAVFNVSILLGFGNGSFQDPLLVVTGKGRLYATVSDFNNDDRMDVVVINTYDSSMRIFLGYGNGSFANPSTYSTGVAPAVVMVADFNDDSRSDIVVANYQDNDISVYTFNLIDFASQSISFGLSDASRLQCIAAGDFNNDNILDIVVVNYGTKNIALLRGRGDGSFTRETSVPLDWNSNPQSIAIADYNKDNQLDLAVANSGTFNIDIFLGNGRGTLIRQNNDGYSLDRPPSIIIADDFNQDGYSEIVVAYNNSDNIDILVAYDPGNFTDQITYSIDLRSNSLAVGDFNQDQILDIVVVASVDDKVGILLGHGDGSFTNHTEYATGISRHSVALGHFNNDTHVDVLVTNVDNEDIGILFGYGNGSFAEAKTYSTGFESTFMAVSDFNNDTFSDIVALSRGSTIIRILLSDGYGSFAKPQLLQTHDLIDDLAVGDVNNDMFMDILVSDFDYQINAFFGYGNGSFRMLTRSAIEFRSYFLTVGNFNNDVWLDIVFINSDDDKVNIRLGYSNGSFAKHSTYSVGCSPTDLTVVDLNNDNQLDIVVSHDKGNNITVLLGDGNGFFTALAKYRTVASPNSVVVGDFNNDTRMDIFAISSDANAIGIMFGNFNQVFKRQMTLTTGDGSSPRALATGDFNNDAHPDIAVVNSGTANLGVFLGYGNGSFATQISSSTISNSSLIAVGHFDNDVHLDAVVVCFNEGTIGIHLGHGNGSFSHHTTYSTGVHAQPKSISVVDFDNDAILDIIVANFDASNVLVFIGHGNGNFTQATEIRISYGAHPISVTVADYNNDKKLDFAIANYGSDNLEIYLQNC